MKNKKIGIIALVIIAAAILATAIVVILGGNGRKLKKQLDLGQKYLSEMNYEEAIATFEKALEIDPMSAEAYLGMAEAYVGMGDLESAKATLEKGIEILSGAGKDTSALEAKLKEVQDKIARIEAEEEARKKAEEEEAKRKTEEERLAALPYIEVQPILEAASDVWGRNWDAWTADDFIAQMGLHQNENNPDIYGDDTHMFYCWPGLIAFGQYAKSKESSGWLDAKGIHINTDEYRFEQEIYSDRKYIIEDCLYTYAAERSLFTYDAVKSYFGFGEAGGAELESGIKVNSDLGEGMVKVWKHGNSDTHTFSIIVDNIEISFLDNSLPSGGREFSIWLSKRIG